MVNAPQELLQQGDVKYRLGHGIVRSGLDFVFEGAFFVNISTLPSSADHELALRADWVTADVEPKVQIADNIHQADCWPNVKYGSSVRVIAEFGRISAMQIKLCRPVVCAQQLTDCMLRTLRSRQVKWRTVSIPASVAAPIGTRPCCSWAEARGLSGILMASMPAAFKNFAPSTSLRKSTPFEGTVSTSVANSLAVSFFQVGALSQRRRSNTGFPLSFSHYPKACGFAFNVGHPQGGFHRFNVLRGGSTAATPPGLRPTLPTARNLPCIRGVSIDKCWCPSMLRGIPALGCAARLIREPGEYAQWPQAWPL